VLTDVLRDAARQYRRRPLAALLLVGLNTSVLLQLAPAGVQAVAWLPLTAVGLVTELFVVAWLGGVIDGSQRSARQSLRAALAAVWAAVRASLLALLYIFGGLLVALALFGGRFDGSGGAVALLMAGAAPLIAFGLAFLAVLVPPLVLDGERRVLLAAARSHRVAAAHFPVCLLIGAADAADIAVDYQRWGVPVLLAVVCALSLLRPFVLGMANALYLRTRQELPVRG
jgi:hypothetical protein